MAWKALASTRWARCTRISWTLGWHWQPSMALMLEGQSIVTASAMASSTTNTHDLRVSQKGNQRGNQKHSQLKDDALVQQDLKRLPGQDLMRLPGEHRLQCATR